MKEGYARSSRLDDLLREKFGLPVEPPKESAICMGDVVRAKADAERAERLATLSDDRPHKGPSTSTEKWVDRRHRRALASAFPDPAQPGATRKRTSGAPATGAKHPKPGLGLAMMLRETGMGHSPNGRRKITPRPS
jgi:hypothetical protein